MKQGGHASESRPFTIDRQNFFVHKRRLAVARKIVAFFSRSRLSQGVLLHSPGSQRLCASRSAKKTAVRRLHHGHTSKGGHVVATPRRLFPPCAPCRLFHGMFLGSAYVPSSDYAHAVKKNRATGRSLPQEAVVAETTRSRPNRDAAGRRQHARVVKTDILGNISSTVPMRSSPTKLQAKRAGASLLTSRGGGNCRRASTFAPSWFPIPSFPVTCSQTSLTKQLAQVVPGMIFQRIKKNHVFSPLFKRFFKIGQWAIRISPLGPPHAPLPGRA